MIKAEVRTAGGKVAVKITVNDEETTWSEWDVSANFPDGCPPEIVELEALRRFAAKLESGRNETLFDLFQTQEFSERVEQLGLWRPEERREPTANPTRSNFIDALRQLNGGGYTPPPQIRITPFTRPDSSDASRNGYAGILGRLALDTEEEDLFPF